MNRKAAAAHMWLAMTVCSILVQACGPGTSPAAIADMPIAQISTPNFTPTPAATLPEAPIAPADTQQVSMSPTSNPRSRVTVSAVNGNIFIRRGPDLAFNSIAILSKGQTAIATSRDVLARWLQIPVPGDPQETGWVTIMTDYTRVAGDVQALPEIEPTEWPELAFLRNCTHHLMEADPGGVIIPPVYYFPDNEVRINPGVYSVHDLDMDKYPEVLSVDIREGSAIDVQVDGTGEKKKCPPP